MAEKCVYALWMTPQHEAQVKGMDYSSGLRHAARGPTAAPGAIICGPCHILVNTLYYGLPVEQIDRD